MATLNATYLSLADLYSRRGGHTGIAKIIEMLAKDNPILQDAPAMECNMGTYHRTTMRTALPSPSWRILNQGTARTKSRTNQIDDTTGKLEDWSQVDADLVDIAVDKAQFMLSESAAHLEGMNQAAATALFYGNTNTDPEQILGLAPRFNSTTAQNGNQIISGGGSGSDNMSIWFVGWGENTCHLLYPKGTTAGLNHENKGKQIVYDSSNNPYDAYVNKFSWHIGLSVRDYRYVVRIANIDSSDLTVDASAGANLFNKLVDGYWQFKQRTAGVANPVIYAPTKVCRYLDHQSRQGNARVLLNWKDWGPDSKPCMHFRDMPIRESHALTEAEATVS